MASELRGDLVGTQLLAGVVYQQVKNAPGIRADRLVQLQRYWERALRELHDGSFPAVFLTVSGRAYHWICTPANGRSLLTQDGTGDANDNERELVRQAITRQLVTDWPAYMQTIIDAGHVSLAP